MRDFEKIYAESGKVIYYYLLSLSGDPAVAEELTQETMLRAMLSIHTFRGDCKITVWLCQIAKNLYFDHQKRAKRTLAMDNKPTPDPSDLTERLEDRETAAHILGHLHELPEPYKEVFTLHALGDIPLNRISKIFGKSDSWARVTYYRAKAMILTKLKEGEP